jgi:hypothetical protein
VGGDDDERRAHAIRLVASVELGDGSFRSLADSRARVSSQPLDFREGTADAMADDDSRGHLPDAPGIVAESAEDRWPGLVIPDPQEPACCPNSQPIGGTRRLIDASGPASRLTAKGQDQSLVGLAASQQ